MNLPELYENEDGPMDCPACDGSGELLVCIDDMCRGMGECVHGDGMRTCPQCKGSGEYQNPK